MANRIVWSMAWTLTLALVLASLAVVALLFATVEHPVTGGSASGTGNGSGNETIECRAFDVMLGRSDECDGWPTGRAMPSVLVTALVAALGVPERRRLALARIGASFALAVSAIVSLRTLADIEFTGSDPAPALMWGVLACALLPLAAVALAIGRDGRDRVDPRPAGVHTGDETGGDRGGDDHAEHGGDLLD